MKPTLLFSRWLSLPALSAAAQATDPSSDKTMVVLGRALPVIGGCNDCHTAGDPESGGKIPHAEWLTGSMVGLQGPWGSRYPADLRLKVQDMTDAQWLARVR